MRCDAVVWEMSVDLRTNAWTMGRCVGLDGSAPKPKQALTARTGTLTESQRLNLQERYGALVEHVALGCGHDGGTLSLTVTRPDGATKRWVDQNWGCGKPAPMMIDGLGEFAHAVVTMQESP